jgi:hypothetical protein
MILASRVVASKGAGSVLHRRILACVRGRSSSCMPMSTKTFSVGSNLRGASAVPPVCALRSLVTATRPLGMPVETIHVRPCWF